MPLAAKLAVAAIVVSAASACADRAQAQSWGALHMPSTTAQYLGYGYGAGHHAPIVRTPAQRPPRMQRRMRAPACYGPLSPADYAPMGCYGGACQGGAIVLSDAARPVPLPPVEEAIPLPFVDEAAEAAARAAMLQPRFAGP